MRTDKPISSFAAAKMSQNLLFAESDTDYYQPGQVRSHQDPPVVQSKTAQEDVMDLEELWDQIEDDRPEQEIKKEGQGSIRVVELGNSDVPMELSPDELEEVFGAMNENPPSRYEKTEEQGEDFSDLWDQVESVDAPKEQVNNKTPNKNEENSIIKSTNFKTSTQSIALAQGKGLSLGKDFLIHDYKAFATTAFGPNIHTHFSLTESPDTHQGKFTLADLKTGKIIVNCQQHRKPGSDSSQNPILKFTLQGGELLATAYPRQLANGHLYLLRMYNPYESCHGETEAYIETTDGFIGQSCYCNSTVYLGSGPNRERLRMVVGVRKGVLIANMGLDGVKSAPYNCRLENARKAFVYLLGQMEEGRFVVRVGEGLSPLLGFAISVARKVYIDSFSQ